MKKEQQANLAELALEYCCLSIQNGIMYCQINPVEEVSLEIARKCVEGRLSLSKGVSYPCLFDIRSIKSTTKEARSYLTEEGIKQVIAGAFLVDSPLTSMIANIYLAIEKPKSPSKVFKSRRKALQWLEKFKSTKNTGEEKVPT